MPIKSFFLLQNVSHDNIINPHIFVLFRWITYELKAILVNILHDLYSKNYIYVEISQLSRWALKNCQNEKKILLDR